MLESSDYLGIIIIGDAPLNTEEGTVGSAEEYHKCAGLKDHIIR
jgi:hypothetical protein